MGVFGDWASRYHEMGYNVLPCDGQRRVIQGKFKWEPWQETKQTSEEINHLVELCGDAPAIAIISGPASGCSIVDLDTDDKAIQRALPPMPIHSNMIRRGSKGLGYFVRYVDPTRIDNNQKKKLSMGEGGDSILEVFFKAQYLVVPPSVSDKIKTPEGQPGGEYIWANNTGITPSNELEEFDQGLLNMGRFIQDYNEFGWKKAREPKKAEQQRMREGFSEGGRNNFLISFAGSLAKKVVEQGYDTKDAIDDLLRHDEIAHSNHQDGPWFCDDTEGHKQKSPEARAKHMLMRLVKSDETKHVVNQAYELKVIEELLRAKDATDKNYDAAKWEALTPKNGFYQLFAEACKDLSGKDNHALAFAGATATILTAAANKRRLGATHSTAIIFALASSGVGKDSPQTVAKKVLMQLVPPGGMPLLGRSFKSVESYESSYLEQRERCDFVDEVVSLFEGAKKPTHPLNRLPQAMCGMFSRSIDLYTGSFAQTKAAKVGAIANPCSIFYGSGVLEEFPRALPDNAFSSGLMGRSLMFIQPKIQETNKETQLPYGMNYLEDEEQGHGLAKELDDNKIYSKLADSLRYLIEEPFICQDGKPYQVDTLVIPTRLGLTRETALMLGKIQEKADKYEQSLRESGEPDGIKLAPSYNRKVEVMNKLVIARLCSEHREAVTPDDIHWAEAVWSLSMEGLTDWVLPGRIEGDDLDQITDAVLRVYEARLHGKGIFKPDSDELNEFNIRTLRRHGKLRQLAMQSWIWDRWLDRMKSWGVVKQFQKGKSPYIRLTLDGIR